ncbi:MAG: hypothetical protein ACE3JQ_09650 [Paenisporosarcina sp.]
MNLHLFREEDQLAAQKEYDYILDCTMLLEIHLTEGNYKQALSLTQDLQKSVQLLQKLIKEKETNSQMNSIASKLVSLGIDASVVCIHFDNKKS